MSEFGQETVNTQPTFTTLQEYEVWAVQDWVFNLGSDDAQLHIRGKLKEEAAEAAEALKSGVQERIVDELGDFLWTANANALNIGLTFEDSLRKEISSDLLGDSSLTPEGIDKLALKLIPEEDADAMAGWITYLGMYLGKASKQWRNMRGDMDASTQPQNFPEAWSKLKLFRAYDGLAQSILVTSAVAQRFGGSTLSEVMTHNFDKLSTRKDSGQPVTTLKI